MTRFFLGLFVSLFAFSIYGQTISVYDEVSGMPIGFVIVASADSTVVSITKNSGTIDLTPYQNVDSIRFIEISHVTKILSYDQLINLPNRLLYLARKPFALDGITVSAAKWQQQKSDVPNKITTILPDQVFFENPQTAADLLKTSGEVYVQKSQLGGGSPMIRGFATNRILLSVDGVRMNNAIFRSGNIQNVISLDPLSIEKTEVAFGPGSVIYGSDAIGGVMSFYTLTPQFAGNDHPAVAGKAFIRGSSANRERTGHIDFNLGYKKIALTTSITYADYENLTMGKIGPSEYLRPEYVVTTNGVDLMATNPNPREQISTAYNQLNVSQKIRYRPSEKLELNYGGHYSATSDFGRYDRQIRYRGDTLHSAEWRYGPQIWMMHNLRMVHHSENGFYNKMSLTAAYQYFRESRHNRDFGVIRRTNQTERVFAPSLNVDFEREIGDRNELYYGAEGVYNLVHSRASIDNIVTGTNGQAQTRYPHNASWWSGSAYLLNQYRATPRLTLLAGSRYSLVGIVANFDTTFLSLPRTSFNLQTGALNGSAGIAYKPSKKWQVNINLSTGFRAPNVDDVGKVFDSEPGSVVVPNPNINSEYAYSAEASATKIFGEVVKVDIAAFYTFLNNALVRRNFNLNGQDSIVYNGELSQVQAIQNAAQATVYGAQAGVEVKFLNQFTLLARANYQTGKEELDDGSTAPARHAPPFFGIARITYECKRLMAGVSTEFNDQVTNANLAPSEKAKDFIYALDNNGNPYSPAWFTFNSRLSYQVKENFMVAVAVENILNVRYRPYSSGISAPGRNFIGSIKYNF